MCVGQGRFTSLAAIHTNLLLIGGFDGAASRAWLAFSTHRDLSAYCTVLCNPRLY